jgi:hypothetical protein
MFRVEAQPIGDGKPVEQRVFDVRIHQLLGLGQGSPRESPSRRAGSKSRIGFADHSLEYLHRAAAATKEHREPSISSAGERIPTLLEVDQVAHDGACRMATELRVDVRRTARAAGMITL